MRNLYGIVDYRQAVVGTNPNLQILYSIQLFIKLYLDCIYVFKIKLDLDWIFGVNYYLDLDFIYELCQYLDLDLLVMGLCPLLRSAVGMTHSLRSDL